MRGLRGASVRGLRRRLSFRGFGQSVFCMRFGAFDQKEGGAVSSEFWTATSGYEEDFSVKPQY